MSPWTLYIVVVLALVLTGATIGARGLPRRRPNESRIMWCLASARWSYTLFAGFDLVLALTVARSFTDVVFIVLCAGICATLAAIGFNEVQILRNRDETEAELRAMLEQEKP